MDASQLKDIVITPVLVALGMNSPSAANLLLGTVAQESQMGHYIAQKGIGLNGGIGIWQVERPTFQLVWDKMVAPDIAMRAKLRLLLGYEGRPGAERMATDLRLNCAIARLLYYSIKEPLPLPNDIAGLARYWKQYYNRGGKGTESEFIANYERYIK